MISSTIEIDRRPDEVFAYAADFDRLSEWQEGVVSVRKETEGPTRVGTRVIELRRTAIGTREFVQDIVEYDPPRRMVARGLNGPIRPTVTATLEPLDAGTRTKLTFGLELTGFGIGKVLALLARRVARARVPRENARLKAILERG